LQNELIIDLPLE